MSSSIRAMLETRRPPRIEAMAAWASLMRATQTTPPVLPVVTGRELLELTFSEDIQEIMDVDVVMANVVYRVRIGAVVIDLRVETQIGTTIQWCLLTPNPHDDDAEGLIETIITGTDTAMNLASLADAIHLLCGTQVYPDAVHLRNILTAVPCDVYPAPSLIYRAQMTFGDLSQVQLWLVRPYADEIHLIAPAKTFRLSYRDDGWYLSDYDGTYPLILTDHATPFLCLIAAIAARMSTD